MPFNPVGRFVEAKLLGLYTRITSILHGLRVNDDQRCPLGFFLTCSRTCPCKAASIVQWFQLLATECASTPLNTAAGLSANLPSCSHFSVDRRYRQWCLVSSSSRVESASFAVISQLVTVQELSILSRLSCWSMTSSLHKRRMITLLHLSKRCQMGSIGAKPTPQVQRWKQHPYGSD